MSRDVKRLREKIEVHGAAFVPAKASDSALHYDTRADVYDSQCTQPAWANRNDLVRDIYRRALAGQVSPRFRHLDYGCGTGLATLQFLASIGTTELVKGVGVDISQKMLEIAQDRLPRYELRRGGPGAIHETRKFDVVTALFCALGHLSAQELEVFFINAARSLKPGGFLCFDGARQLAVGERGFSDQDVAGKNRYIAYYSTLEDGSYVCGQDGLPLIGFERMFSEDEIALWAGGVGLTPTVLETVTVEHPNPSVGVIKDLVVVLQK